MNFLKHLDQNVVSITGMGSTSKTEQFPFDHCLPNFKIEGAMNVC